jgi:dihydrofolate reductase
MTLPVLLAPPADCDVPVRVNWSRWISFCATPGCTNAWQVNIGTILWMCRDCWAVIRPTWPADPGAIAWVLSQRPDEKTRNWLPGETITDLLMENAAHGIDMPGIEPGTDDVLTEVDGRAVSGALLPAIEHARTMLTDGPFGPLALPEGN